MRTYHVEVWYSSLPSNEDRAVRMVEAQDIAAALAAVTDEMDQAASTRPDMTFRVTSIQEIR